MNDNLSGKELFLVFCIFHCDLLAFFVYAYLPSGFGADFEIGLYWFQIIVTV